MRAALYGRYSTDKQSESSIADQERVTRRIAERHGFGVVAEFSDAALSGGTALRPGYQRMLAAARRGEFDVIVAEDISRLWRSMAEQAPRLAELTDLGVAVVTVDFDSRTESAGILSAVNGAMSEQYRKEIARRTRRGLEGIARAGRSAGGRAYGYISATDSPTNQREVDPEQAAVVGRIFQMYADGASPRTIAATLNAEGIASPGASWARTLRRRRGWVASAINGDAVRGVGILNNDIYRGVQVWNRLRWVRSAADSQRRRPVLNPRSEWIEHHDERLRIVPDELWNRVKARQQHQAATVGARVKAGLSRKQAASGRVPRYLFSGWLVCGCCGSRFTLVNRRSYGCASYINGKACSNSLTVRRELVESRLLAGIREALSAEDVAVEVERRVRGALADRRRKKPDTKRIALLHGQVENLVTAIANGGLRASPALGRRLREVEQELDGITRQANAAPVAVPLVTDIRARFERLLERLPQALLTQPEQARAQLQDVLGPEITLRPAAEGGYLQAEIGIEVMPMAVSAGVSEKMVAGACYRDYRHRAISRSRCGSSRPVGRLAPLPAPRPSPGPPPPAT